MIGNSQAFAGIATLEVETGEWTFIDHQIIGQEVAAADVVGDFEFKYALSVLIEEAARDTKNAQDDGRYHVFFTASYWMEGWSAGGDEEPEYELEMKVESLFFTRVPDVEPFPEEDTEELPPITVTKHPVRPE